jgi:hypothetical protein
MATSTGDQLAQGIRQQIDELKKACEGLDESIASLAPAGRWSPKEILSHLLGPEGTDHLLTLQSFLDRETPRIDIEADNPFFSEKRSQMTFTQLLSEVASEYDKISRFAAGLSENQLARKAHIPMLKGSSFGEYLTLATWIGLLGGQEESHLHFHINHMREILHDLETRKVATGKKQEGKMDMQEMMGAYKKLATPGAPHKLLASLAGSWITKSKAWMNPDEPPMEGSGACEQKMLLGGRYLQQVYTGEMMGEQFTGINLLGYDNHTGKYVSTWIDSMSTGIYCFEGTADAGGKNITQECCYDDPVRGPMSWRSVTRIVDDRTLEYEMFLTPEGGKEERASVMTVTRKP